MPKKRYTHPSTRLRMRPEQSRGTLYAIGYKKPVYAVVLVGGKGKRLRPLSTDSLPKAFLSVTKDRKTMFKATIERITKLIPSANILVAANRIHSRLVKRDFPKMGRNNLVLEPVSRNTAPAIFFAARLLKSRCEDAIMAIIPADQYIIDEGKYLDSVRSGIGFVNNNANAIIALGVTPKYPAAGLGYIKLRREKTMDKSIYKVERFVEKPDLTTARRYLKSGDYLWNAGAFIFTANCISDAVRRFKPDIFERLNTLDNIEGRYSRLPDISIDYAVMEKAGNIYCVKGTYGWQDMGSFESLKYVLDREGRRYIEKDGKILKIL